MISTLGSYSDKVSDISSGSIYTAHIFWHSFWHILWFYPTFFLGFCLASILAVYLASSLLPICSMYGIFTCIWVIFRANVGKYSIHGASGLFWHFFWHVFGSSYLLSLRRMARFRACVSTELELAMSCWHSTDTWWNLETLTWQVRGWGLGKHQKLGIEMDLRKL